MVKNIIKEMIRNSYKAKDIERYNFLKGEQDRLYAELRNVKPETSCEEIERLRGEYAKVQEEKERLDRKYSLKYNDLMENLCLAKLCPDIIEAEAELEKMEHNLRTYCDFQITRLTEMKKQLKGAKLPFGKRIRRGLLIRGINKEITRYFKRKKDLVI